MQGAGSDAWCSSDEESNGMTVHRLARCWEAGRPPPAARACVTPEDTARPSVLILTVAMGNDSFGLIRDKGLINKGPRGISGFMGMLAEQVRALVTA
jgi:hypothetical protein